MSDEQTPATPASLPSIDDVQKMSAAQRNLTIAKFGTDAELYSKTFVVGDGPATKLLQALLEHGRNADKAEQIVTTAEDPLLPQPREGGANINGMSHRDEVLGAQWLLEDGVPVESVAEFEECSNTGKPIVPQPEVFRDLERRVNRCIETPGFAKHPEAKLILALWGMISTTSRPLPPVPSVVK